MSYIDEAQVEIVTVDYFRELGYEYIHGPVIAPQGEAPERQGTS
jgi:type I restriction enzyme, R subunit